MTSSPISSPPSSERDALYLRLKLEQERRRRLRGDLVFRGAAGEAQTITASEWIISGPAETGKTFASMTRLHRECMRVGNARFVIVRKVRAWIYETALRTWERVIVQGPMKPKKYGGVRPFLYVYPNGTTVFIAGLDVSGSVLSGEFDGVYVNQAEELTSDDWETLTTRTTGRGAKTETPMLFGDCNPDDPEHWILQRHAAGSLTLLYSRHIDNPSLHDGTDWTAQGIRTISKLQALTGPRYARLYMGEWVRDDGPESFLPSMAMYDACRVDIPALTPSQPMVIALDAALTGDTFALVGVTRHPDDPEHLVVRISRMWVPGGEPLDFTAIEVEIRAIIAAYNVVQVCYDPYQMHYFSQRLADSVWIEPFNQGNDRLEADAGLRALFIQRRISHDGTHHTLREHLSNADSRMDETGHKLRLVKRSAHLKIDAAVALSMACSRALSLNLY